MQSFIRYICLVAPQETMIDSTNYIMQVFGESNLVCWSIAVTLLMISMNLMYSSGRAVLFTGILEQFEFLTESYALHLVQLFLFVNMSIFCTKNPIREIIDLTCGWWIVWLCLWTFILLYPILYLLAELIEVVDLDRHVLRRMKRVYISWYPWASAYYSAFAAKFDPKLYPMYIFSFLTIQLRLLWDCGFKYFGMTVILVFDSLDQLEHTLEFALLRVAFRFRLFGGNISRCCKFASIVAQLISLILTCLLAVLLTSGITYILLYTLGYL